MVLVALAFVAAASVGILSAKESAIWLHVQVSETGSTTPKVTINMPLSLIEVVIESADAGDILKEIKSEKGIDLAKLWRQLRDADMDEFVTIDAEEAKVKVYKDRRNFRLTVEDLEHGEGNVEVRIPFEVMDYLFEEEHEDFKLSDLVGALRGDLPLVLVEANHDGDMVKVWLEEK
jgi:hypothetical protein